MARLVIFSGPPGCGKSTLSYLLSKKTGWAIITRDTIDRALEKADAYNPRAGYEIIFELAHLNLSQGVSIILDAVFTTKEIQRQIIDIGQETNARSYIIICTCSDETVWKERITQRPEVVDGWTPADWTEVERVREAYHTWSLPHLELDAVDVLEENFSALVSYVSG